jgi:hypothetical protein
MPDQVENPSAMTAQEQKSYERAQEWLMSGAKTLVGAYVGLLALDVSVIASSLPYIYVNDDKANCGARFLVHYGAHCVTECGCLAMLTIGAAVALIGFIEEERKPNSKLPLNWLFIYITALGVLGVAFLIAVSSQIETLGNPPPLPDSLPRLHDSKSSADSRPIDTHACTELAPSPSP